MCEWKNEKMKKWNFSAAAHPRRQSSTRRRNGDMHPLAAECRDNLLYVMSAGAEFDAVAAELMNKYPFLEAFFHL